MNGTQQHHEPPPRVAAYCRYSIDAQNPRSVADQLKLCQRYAERQGWPPIQPESVFADEAASGSSSHRTSYQKLLAVIAGSNGRPPYDVILIENFDRLARDMIEMSRLVRMAPIWGLRIVDVSDNQDITDDGALYKGIGNQRFLKDLHRKIRRGLAGRFEDGFHAGGSTFGYRSVPVAHPSGRVDRFGRPLLLGYRLEPWPEEAEVVKRIFLEAATGLSPREIAFGLDRDGVPKPCARYEGMTKGAGRKATPWNPGTVSSILRNARYRGVWKYQKTLSVGTHPDTGKKIMRRAPEGETLERVREDLRLIDEKLWNTVQDILDARAAGVLKDPKSGRLMGREKGCTPGQVFGKNITPLNGLVVCAECGGPFNVLMSKPGPDGRVIRYLGCIHRHHFKGRCGNTGLCRLSGLEEALQSALEGYFSNSKLMEAHFRRFQEALTAHRMQLTAEEERARAEITAAEVEIGHIKKAILRGVVGDTTAAMLREAEAKKAEAGKALEAAEAARAGEPKLVPPQEILRGLHAQRLQEKRQAYRRLLSEIRLRSERKPGRRMVTRWRAEIVPLPSAGITLPESVALGKDGITIGRYTSGRDARRACGGG